MGKLLSAIAVQIVRRCTAILFLMTASVATAHAASVTPLVSFGGTNGSEPDGSLIADAAGNLFGTTILGGASGDGTVFEIMKTASGYASTPTTLVSFNDTNQAAPLGSLLRDASGDLFGTTYGRYANAPGTVFEIAKTPTGYASTPTTLVSFNGTNGAGPEGNLIADAAGDMFGTTIAGGADGHGTIFEIAKIGGSNASTATTLVNFNVTNGEGPQGKLIADAAGNLFGVAGAGGASGGGTVFEIAKTGGSYASAPITLVSFNGVNGSLPVGGVIADAAGDLFGATFEGGAYGKGTVFEIIKTPSGYASTPTILANFSGTNGSYPWDSLIIDAAGDLFGTTETGGPEHDLPGDGTVFELPYIDGRYASTLSTLGNLSNGTGDFPESGLLADVEGNLFGTALYGGAYGDGTVFEFLPTGTPNVPEPATVALLATGLTGVMFTRRRKRSYRNNLSQRKGIHGNHDDGL